MISATVGEVIGPYRVVQFLGRGSFGVVLLVQGPGHERWRRAMKLVPCDHLDDQEAAKATATALAEAQLMQRLRHPHIVSCHDVQYDAHRRSVWLALDYMDGGDLQNVIRSRRVNLGQPFEGAFQRCMLCAVGSALSYIHSEGVLHRDVKPANVLLAAGLREIKLADFGISKLLEASGHAGTILGTPAYMSPELVCGKPYGRAADAWAFGAVMYELATLMRPFEASNQLALVWQIVEQQPPELPSGTPGDVAQAIKGLLEKDPDQRLRLEDLDLELPPDVEAECSGSLSFAGEAAPPEQPLFQNVLEQRLQDSLSDWSGAQAVLEHHGSSSASAPYLPPEVVSGDASSSEAFQQNPQKLWMLGGSDSSVPSSEGLSGFLKQEIDEPNSQSYVLQVPPLEGGAASSSFSSAPRMPPPLARKQSEYSDVEEVLVEDVRLSSPADHELPSPRAGASAAFELAPEPSPRRTWFSRLGLGLRYGTRSAATGRDQTMVSAFNQSDEQN